MIQNFFHVPEELCRDLPAGYQGILYVGRMTGQLKADPFNAAHSQFAFEIYAHDDPTQMLLRYLAPSASGEELARWENVGDAVGVVIADNKHDKKGSSMSLLMAYNFTRNKWFATGYYPHVQDRSLAGNLSEYKIRNLLPVAALLSFCFGIGILLMIWMEWGGIRPKRRQYGVINPPGYRTQTAKGIADWISANKEMFARAANPSADPSL